MNSTNSCRTINTVSTILNAVTWLAALALMATSCKSTGQLPPVKTYVQAKKEVAAKGPLIDEPAEKRKNIPKGDIKRLDKDKPAPYTGSLLDENEVKRYIAIRTERDRRRKELVASREKAEIQKLVYESTIRNLQAALQARQTWWEQNKGLVGLLTGTVLGMAIVTGLVYGLTKGQGATVTTNPHVLPHIRARPLLP